MRRRAELAGILDWFRKKRPEAEMAPPSGQIIYVGPGGEAKRELPVVPKGPPELPALETRKPSVEERLLSLFKAFEPGESNLPVLAERINILPAESNLPAVLKKFEILPDSIKPSPPKELSVSEEERQLELWSTLFGESEEGEGPLFEELPGRKEGERVTVLVDQPPAFSPFYRPPHEEWPRGEPPIYWVTHWRIPNAYAVAHWLQNSPDIWDLNGIFEYTLSQTTDPYWRRQVEESPHTGEPAETMIQDVAHWSTAYEDLANLLQIPQRVVDVYFAEVQTEERAHERAWLFEREVLGPYLENLEKAFEALRPVELRGWFEISPDDDYSWSLKYKEAKFPQR